MQSSCFSKATIGFFPSHASRGILLAASASIEACERRRESDGPRTGAGSILEPAALPARGVDWQSSTRLVGILEPEQYRAWGWERRVFCGSAERERREKARGGPRAHRGSRCIGLRARAALSRRAARTERKVGRRSSAADTI
jgi:hypothetical protein